MTWSGFKPKIQISLACLLVYLLIYCFNGFARIRSRYNTEPVPRYLDNTSDSRYNSEPVPSYLDNTRDLSNVSGGTSLPDQGSEYEQRLLKTQELSDTMLSAIKSRCKALGLPRYWNYKWHFVEPRIMILKEVYPILYVSNPKTGSTSFKKFLFILDGVDRPADFHHHPAGHYRFVNNASFKGVPEKSFGNLVKIVSIRNPLTRLISAFRDKQLRHHTYFEPNLDEVSSDFTMFERFIDESLNAPEFQTDVHLMTQWDQIEVCRFPYDVLMQFEDLDRYIELIQELSYTKQYQYPGSRTEVGKDTKDSLYYANYFYNQLDEKRFEIIYQKYDMDFKVFGYTKFGEAGFPNTKK